MNSRTYSYAATDDSVFVIFDSKDDFPTDGKPIRATRASPDLVTCSLRFSTADAGSVIHARRSLRLAFRTSCLAQEAVPVDQCLRNATSPRNFVDSPYTSRALPSVSPDGTPWPCSSASLPSPASGTSVYTIAGDNLRLAAETAILVARPPNKAY